MRWKSLLHGTFHSRVPIPSVRFFSSLSLTKTPSNPHIGFAKDLVASSNPSFRHPIHGLSIVETEALHSRLIKTPALWSDVFVTNCLADAYFKAGSANFALRLLGEIPHPNVVSWNLTISIYNRTSRFEGSLRSFCSMRMSGLEPTEFAYGSVLSACAASADLRFGGQVYSLVVKNGFFSDGYVFTGLVDLFAKSCRFDEALGVFSEISTENVVCWNAIIAGGVRNGENRVALDLFCRMVNGFCTPNGFTFSSVLTACTGARELELGRGIHGWVVRCGVEDDVFVGTAIVDLYAKCGDIDYAVKEFSLMPVHNVVSWTAIISGFVQREESAYALRFFKDMKRTCSEINKYTVTSVLSACAKSEMAKEASQIHCWTLKTGFSTDHVVRDALISTYAKFGKIEMSEKVFEEKGIVKDVGSWAAMIAGLVQNESSSRSVKLFRRMFLDGLRPDEFCSSSVLSIITCVDWGKQLHSYVVKTGLVFSLPVASALFTMYSRCSSLDDSHELFKQMPERDGVAWTSMIAGLAEHGHVDEAFRLFREMILEEIEPDQITLSSVITACSAQQSLIKGKEIHGHALRAGFGTDVLIGGALITMYSKCGALDSAVRFFNRMPQEDQFSWSSMVSGYAQNGYGKEALLEFRRMLIAGFEIDCFTCSSVLGACAILFRLALGKQLHAHVMKVGLSFHLSVSSALVTVYSKCGSIDDSRKVFDEIEKPDLVSWTAMIDSYAQHGKGEEALKIYELVKEDGTEPDSVTLLSVLSACSHNGLVEEGFFHFNSMARDYGIEPEACHYACMVDLLSRSGRLKEAASFINKMPIEPDALMWSTLLGACRVHGDVELGRVAAEKVLELDPRDSGAYISLSNISADMGDWEEVLMIRSSMKGGGVKKEHGWSLV